MTRHPEYSNQKNVDSKYMWKFLLLAMFALIAFLVIRKQQKKKEPRSATSKQLVEKADIADIFGEDLLDTFKTR
jgi:preprotein translocase subunit YajC